MSHYADKLVQTAFNAIRRDPEHLSCAWLKDRSAPYIPHPTDIDVTPLNELKGIYDQFLGHNDNVTGHLLVNGPRGVGRMCIVGDSIDACALSLGVGEVNALIVVGLSIGTVAIKDGIKPLSDCDIQWLTLRTQPTQPVGLRNYRRRAR